MTVFGLLPLPVHAALRLLTGLLTILAPFALGFDPAGLVLSVVIGALVVGMALLAVGDERGRPVVPVASLFAWDYGVVLGTLGAALLLGVAGDTAAGLGLCAIALVQLGGNLLTRYSARG